jgi:hypothetical protein
MKLAWLCYTHTYEPDDYLQEIFIVFEEPPKWKYAKVVPIVYAEIVQ